jgi:hypothetical protein
MSSPANPRPTARVIPFPRHPVRVFRDADYWLVQWRNCYWVHTSHGAALADAHRIASAHNQRVINHARPDTWGGAA